MSNFDQNRFASNNQEYETPDYLFTVLDDEFHFTLDVCADKNNKKVDRFISAQQDSLSMEWKGACWMNPPYKNMKAWVEKAYRESRKDDCVVVCLIPARTNTNWWHKFCMKGEVRFLRGRPKFVGCKHGLPQPLAIIVFGVKYYGNYKSVEFSARNTHAAD